MPDHVHLLIGEPPAAPPSTILQVFKQRLSRRMRDRKRARKEQFSLPFAEPGDALRRFWQRRYYDFNVYSQAKVLEKLHYMHANPVKEKLARHPADWPWSSWCFYHGREALLQMDPHDGPSPDVPSAAEEGPSLCKNRRVGHPRGSLLAVRHPTP